MYKIINWYTKRFSFPHRGLKFFRTFLRFFGIYNKKFCKRLHNGMLMYVQPSEHIQQQLFWYGYYEKNAILTWERFIPERACVADIGANAGYYSLVASKKAEIVYAFEPVTTLRHQLEENIRLNLVKNVIAVPLAVSNSTGRSNIYLSASDNTGMSGLTKPENFAGQMEATDIVCFDDWAARNNISGIDCIKLDVEGAEFKVLSGMQETLQRSCPVLFIEIIAEWLAKFGDQPADIYGFLEQLHFVPYDIIKPGALRRLHEQKESESVVFIHRDFRVPGSITLH